MMLTISFKLLQVERIVAFGSLAVDIIFICTRKKYKEITV